MLFHLCCPLSAKHSLLTAIRHGVRRACLPRVLLRQIGGVLPGKTEISFHLSEWKKLSNPSAKRRAITQGPTHSMNAAEDRWLFYPFQFSQILWNWFVWSINSKSMLRATENHSEWTVPVHVFAHAMHLFNIFNLNRSPPQWNDWLKSAWLFQHYSLCKLRVVFYFKAVKI